MKIIYAFKGLFNELYLETITGVGQMNNILEITPPPLPFDPDDKIFSTCDEDCRSNCAKHPKVSYNDQLKQFESITGISEDLLGKAT